MTAITRVLSPSLVLISFLALGAAEPTVTVTCPKPSHLYRVGDRAEFDVTASVTGAPVRITFARGNLPPMETIVTTAPCRVSHALGEPGFIVCSARSGKGPVASAGAGFDPLKIRTALPPPKDYDAFWTDAFAEQEAIAPDFTSKPCSNDVELVSCQTVQGTRLYGFLHIPHGGRDGKTYPLRVNVGGGDSFRWVDEAVGSANGSEGFLYIHLPPWEPTEKTYEAAKARHKKWCAQAGTGCLYAWHNTGTPRERWYYRCILGSCRLIDCAVKRAGVDPKRVYYRGASTGGGYGLFLAAFSPHIRAAVCEVPNYGNAGGPSVGRPSGEDDRGRHWQTSLYYDAAYCAPRITCPVFMTCGYIDGSCVPETIYCSYNALTCPKTMVDLVTCGHGSLRAAKSPLRERWLAAALKGEPPVNSALASALTAPDAYADFARAHRLTARHACPDFDVEVYEQANGPDTTQRVMMAVPHGLKGRAPCVVAPFYFPEALLGFNPADGSLTCPYVHAKTNLTYYSTRFMADLARRGYIVLSADAAYITYLRPDAGSFNPSTGAGGSWEQFGEALTHDWPNWIGMGKLVFDTRLLVDLATQDPRVDAARIGMIGHSLGGKMAYYAGMTDPRVKVVVASDFGLGWTQTNWHSCWYWGNAIGRLRAQGLSQADLLSASGGTPFCLIAGQADDADSGILMRSARGYEGHPEKLLFLRHGTGHRPPPDTVQAGYRFIDRYLKSK